MFKYRTTNDNYFPLVPYTELSNEVFVNREAAYTIVGENLVFISKQSGEYTVIVNNNPESLSKHYSFESLYEELPTLCHNINKEYMNEVVCNILEKYGIGRNSLKRKIEESKESLNTSGEDFYHIIMLSQGLNVHDNTLEAREHFIPLLEVIVEKAYSKLSVAPKKESCCFWNEAVKAAEQYLDNVSL